MNFDINKLIDDSFNEVMSELNAGSALAQPNDFAQSPMAGAVQENMSQTPEWEQESPDWFRERLAGARQRNPELSADQHRQNASLINQQIIERGMNEAPEPPQSGNDAQIADYNFRFNVWQQEQQKRIADYAQGDPAKAQYYSNILQHKLAGYPQPKPAMPMSQVPAHAIGAATSLAGNVAAAPFRYGGRVAMGGSITPDAWTEQTADVISGAGNLIHQKQYEGYDPATGGTAAVQAVADMAAQLPLFGLAGRAIGPMMAANYAEANKDDPNAGWNAVVQGVSNQLFMLPWVKSVFNSPANVGSFVERVAQRVPQTGKAVFAQAVTDAYTEKMSPEEFLGHLMQTAGTMGLIDQASGAIHGIANRNAPRPQPDHVFAGNEQTPSAWREVIERRGAPLRPQDIAALTPKPERLPSDAPLPSYQAPKRQIIVREQPPQPTVDAQEAAALRQMRQAVEGVAPRTEESGIPKELHTLRSPQTHIERPFGVEQVQDAPLLPVRGDVAPPLQDSEVVRPSSTPYPEGVVPAESQRTPPYARQQPIQSEESLTARRADTSSFESYIPETSQTPEGVLPERRSGPVETADVRPSPDLTPQAESVPRSYEELQKLIDQRESDLEAKGFRPTYDKPSTGDAELDRLYTRRDEIGNKETASVKSSIEKAMTDSGFTPEESSRILTNVFHLREGDTLGTNTYGFAEHGVKALDPAVKSETLAAMARTAFQAQAEAMAKKGLDLHGMIESPMSAWDQKTKTAFVQDIARKAETAYNKIQELASRRQLPADATPNVAEAVPQRAPLIDRWINSKNEALAEWQQKHAGRLPSLFDPTDIPLLVRIGVGYLAEGIRSAKEFYGKMRDLMGPDTKDSDIAPIYFQARREHSRGQEEIRAFKADQKAAKPFTIPQSEGTKTTINKLTGVRQPVPQDMKLLKAKLSTEQKILGKDLTNEQKEQAEFIPQSETTKQTVNRTTGVKRVGGNVVNEMEALKIKMAAASKASSQGYKAAVEQTTGIRKELARIIQENIPGEERGKLLNAVAGADSLFKVRQAVRRASEVLADHDVKQAIGDLEQLVGPIKLPKLGPKEKPEYTAKEKPPGPGEHAPDDIKRNKIDPLNFDESMRSEVKQLREQAKGLKIRMMAAENVEQKYQIVDEAKKVDRRLRELETDRINSKEIYVAGKKAMRDEVGEEIVKGINAPEPDDISNSPLGKQSRARHLARSMLNMPNILGKMLGSKSRAHQVTIEDIRTGEGREKDFKRNYSIERDALLEKAGIPVGTKKLYEWVNTEEAVKLPGLGREMKLTRSQQLGLVASYRDSLMKLLVDSGKHGGWNHETRSSETPIKLSADDFAALEARLTPAEKALMPFFTEYLKKNVEADARKAKIEMSGWAPDFHENYFKSKVNHRGGSDAGMPEGWRGYHRLLENPTSMEVRTKHSQPFFIPDFLEATDQYIGEAAKLIHMAKPVRSAMMVWGHEPVRQALKRKYGDSMPERFKRYFEDVMEVSVKPPATGGEKLIDTLQRNFARSVLAANPSPVAKNMIGGTVALLPEFEMDAYIHGLKHALSPETFREMTGRDGSGVAYDRYYGGGFYRNLTILAGERQLPETRLSFKEAIKARKPMAAIDALPFMQYADSVPLRVAWEASKYTVNKQHPDWTPDQKHQAVLDKFHEVIYRTQNGTSATEISGWASDSRRSSAMRPFLMFTSDRNKMLNQLARIPEADAKTKMKILLAWSANAAVMAGVPLALGKGAAMTGRMLTGAQKPEDEDSAAMAKVGWDVLGGLMGPAYGGDTLRDLIKASTTKYNPNQKFLSAPVLDVSEDTLKGIAKLAQAVNRVAESSGNKKVDAAWDALEKAGWDSLMAGSTLSGVPLPPLARLGQKVYKAATYKPR